MSRIIIRAVCISFNANHLHYTLYKKPSLIFEQYDPKFVHSLLLLPSATELTDMCKYDDQQRNSHAYWSRYLQT